MQPSALPDAEVTFFTTGEAAQASSASDVPPRQDSVSLVIPFLNSRRDVVEGAGGDPPLEWRTVSPSLAGRWAPIVATAASGSGVNMLSWTYFEALMQREWSAAQQRRRSGLQSRRRGRPPAAIISTGSSPVEEEDEDDDSGRRHAVEGGLVEPTRQRLVLLLTPPLTPQRGTDVAAGAVAPLMLPPPPPGALPITDEGGASAGSALVPYRRGEDRTGDPGATSTVPVRAATLPLKRGLWRYLADDTSADAMDGRGGGTTSPSSANRRSGEGTAAGDGSYYQRHFREIRELGRGASGTVCLCQHLVDYDVPLGLFAVKKVPVGQDNAYLKKVLTEVRILCCVGKHPNVVQYFHAWLEDGCTPTAFGPPVRCLFVLMEFAGLGSLDGLLHQRLLRRVQMELALWRRMRKSASTATTAAAGSGGGKPSSSFSPPSMPPPSRADVDPSGRRDATTEGGAPMPACGATGFLPPPLISDKRIVQFLLQTLKGLRHLHRRNILHRDIKPQNILLQHEELDDTTTSSSDDDESRGVVEEEAAAAEAAANGGSGVSHLFNDSDDETCAAAETTTSATGGLAGNALTTTVHAGSATSARPRRQRKRIRALLCDFGTAAAFGAAAFPFNAMFPPGGESNSSNPTAGGGPALRTGGTGTEDYMAPELFDLEPPVAASTTSGRQSVPPGGDLDGDVSAAAAGGGSGHSPPQYVHCHTSASDMYSLGCVLHSMLFDGRLPYQVPVQQAELRSADGGSAHIDAAVLACDPEYPAWLEEKYQRVLVEEVEAHLSPSQRIDWMRFLDAWRHQQQQQGARARDGGGHHHHPVASPPADDGVTSSPLVRLKDLLHRAVPFQPCPRRRAELVQLARLLLRRRPEHRPSASRAIKLLRLWIATQRWQRRSAAGGMPIPGAPLGSGSHANSTTTHEGQLVPVASCPPRGREEGGDAGGPPLRVRPPVGAVPANGRLLLTMGADPGPDHPDEAEPGLPAAPTEAMAAVTGPSMPRRTGLLVAAALTGVAALGAIARLLWRPAAALSPQSGGSVVGTSSLSTAATTRNRQPHVS